MGLSWMVVVFTEEDAVETIPAKWITENNTYAYWPNTKGRNLKEKIQLCAEPDEINWEKFRIRVLGRGKVYDSYFEAKNAAKKAENTSDINNSDDGTSKRRPKPNPIYESSEDEEISLGLPIREKLCKKFDHPKENGELDGPTASKNLASAWPNTNELTSGSICTKDCPSTYMLKKIMDQNIILNQKLNDLSVDIAHILSMLVNTESRNCPMKETDFNLPVNSNEELETFEEQLQNPEKFNEMVQFVTRIGGFNPYQSIKRALTRIMGNNLQIEFSWLGAKGKKAFAKLNLAKILIRGVLQNPACVKCSEDEIEKAIKGYLKHAVDRETVLKKKINGKQ